MKDDVSPAAFARPRRSLFQKYFLVLFVAVVVPLIINGASEAWFDYRDQRSNLSSRLRAEANSAAGQIQAFLDGVRAQMDWTVQLPWLEGLDDRHRFDALRLLRRAPAINEVTLVDGKGIERLHVSRTDPDVVMSGVDHSTDPAVVGARGACLVRPADAAPWLRAFHDRCGRWRETQRRRHYRRDQPETDLGCDLRDSYR